jgi:hypothetical protein
MPEFLHDVFRRKDTASVNQYEGFQSNGAVVLRDRRGTVKADFPDADNKGFSGGDDPLAIYEPTGAKTVDAAKAMGNFTGWTFAAVNAIAGEVSNIQLRLYHASASRRWPGTTTTRASMRPTDAASSSRLAPSPRSVRSSRTALIALSLTRDHQPLRHGNIRGQGYFH